MSSHRKITWEGTEYYEADIGEELFEAMRADSTTADESQDIGDAAHSRDRIFMRWTFFGRTTVRTYILSRLAQLGL